MPIEITDGRRTILQVPSSSAIENRLRQLQAEAEKLRVVLRLAIELEAVDGSPSNELSEKGASRD